jgi:PKD repeat protein
VSSYQWNFGTKAIPDTVSSKEPPVIHFTDTGVHTVQLVANNSYGSDTFYRNVYIERDTIEPPYFSKWSDTFCLGDHFEFAVQEKPYYLNYSWTSGGNYVDSVAANSPTCQITFLKSGYTVIQAHVFSKCAENKSSIDSIYVLDTAFQDFSLMIDGREIEASPDSGYALWYKWDFGNGHSSDEKSPLYLYDSGGTYLVSLVLGSHCAIDTLTQEIYIQGAGVKRIQNERAYIFPNPVVRTQALQISNNSFDHYEIWTTAGIVLVRDEIKSESIDLNTIQAGTYFIVLMNGDIRVIQRLIIL